MELPSWDTVLKFIETLGWVKGVFTIFFFLAHFWIWRLYLGRLKDRQKEIDRLAKENHEYRDRLFELFDKRFELPAKRSDSSALNQSQTTPDNLLPPASEEEPPNKPRQREKKKV